MDHLFEGIAFGLFGAMIGFLLPAAARRLAVYKCTAKETAFPETVSFMSHSMRGAIILANAAAWAVVSQRIASVWGAVLAAVMCSLAILIAAIDWKIRIIPNELVLVMLASGILLQAAGLSRTSLLFAALSMAGMMALFLIVAVLTGSGSVGAGDVKLAGAMGFLLGYPGIVTALLIMSGSMLLCILVGLVQRRLTRYSMIPLGPFLMLGLSISLMIN